MSKIQDGLKSFLLVEDDDDHAELIRLAIQDANLDIELINLPDGEAAMAYLWKEPPYENACRPNVILLDINMPKMNGHEVLAKIKSANALSRIPVVMLTTSQSELDRDRAYSNMVDSFVSKPTHPAEFEQLVVHLAHYWSNAEM